MNAVTLTAPRCDTRSWIPWVTVIAGFVFSLALAQDAAANCQGGSTALSVPSGTSGANLQTIIAGSTKPCTLNVPPGTYVASAQFTISDGITVRATGPGSTTLQVSSSPAPFAAVAFLSANNRCPSGAVLDGFTLTGGSWGVFASALSGGAQLGVCPSNQITGITLRNLTISTLVSAGSGHGINFDGVQSSVIDTCTVVVAYANGIILGGGSNNNLVMNSIVQRTVTQHAIAVQESNDNVIVGNTITGSAFDGILLIKGPSGSGSSRNRIERNTISGHLVDGITLTDASGFNYVGLNTAVSSSYDPVSKPTPNPTTGTGIWVNNASNGNYLFGNDLSGSPENGIDILTSSSTYVQANRVHANYQGGIWVANVLAATDPNSPPPAPKYTVLQGNNIFFNTLNAQVNLEGATNVDVAYNYLSGVSNPQSGTLAGNSTGAVRIHEATRGAVASGSVNVYENTMTDVSNRAVVNGTTTATQFFRNRFLNGVNDPNAPGGRQGITYVTPPAGVQWSASGLLGGNHWSDFTGATGNPDSGSHPYTAFIGNAGGPYADRFPYQSESLGAPYATYSVSVLEPIAGSVLAAGTKKTVRWSARGCTLVNIYWVSGGASGLIASNYPNVGHDVWTVPTVTFRSDYSVRVACLNSSGTQVGPQSDGPLFTIAASNLVLMNPGRAFRAADGGTVRVAWTRTAAVTGVNVFVKSAAGAETQVATNVAGDFTDVILPGTVSDSSHVTIRIQDSGNIVNQDSVDGYFMVRGATPSFTTALAGYSVQIGSIQPLEWNGTSGSYTVDLDLYENNALVGAIVKNLPDFGNYTWFVPDVSSTNGWAFIHATFKDASGATISATNSGTFEVFSVEHTHRGPIVDFDGDGKADIAVYRPSNGTWYVLESSTNYTAGAAYVWGVSTDVPVPGDYDGDGRTDIAIYRPSTANWFVLKSSTNFTAWDTYQWGSTGDIPVQADYDGDGKTDIAIYRPSSGMWYILKSSTGFTVGAGYAWGASGDVPVTGDYDGDGKTDIAVYRPSTAHWFILKSSTNFTAWDTYQWGSTGDLPVPADYDGDTKTDIAIYRPSTGTWYILKSSTGFTGGAGYAWGVSGDVPVPGDYDGDGKADVAVYRPSTANWFVLKSTTNFTTWDTYQWGTTGDISLKPR